MSDIVRTSWSLGPWMRREATALGPAPHRAPWETYTRLDTIWADAEHTIPVAVRDYDGCEALVTSEEAVERVGKAMEGTG